MYGHVQLSSSLRQKNEHIMMEWWTVAGIWAFDIFVFRFISVQIKTILVTCVNTNGVCSLVVFYGWRNLNKFEISLFPEAGTISIVSRKAWTKMIRSYNYGHVSFAMLDNYDEIREVCFQENRHLCAMTIPISKQWFQKYKKA